MEAQIYEDMLQLEDKHWWFIARRKIIADVLSKSIKQDHVKIFDAGCGNGDNLKMLSEFGEVTAIEKDSSACQRAANRQVCQVFPGELPNNIPNEIKDEFNLVVLLDVLEHIDDDTGSLEKLNSLLTDRGQIFITVPAFPFLWSQHDELHHHKRRYTRNKLQTIMNKSGFDIEFISYFNTLLFPLALIDRIIKKMTANNEVMALPPAWLNQLLMSIFKLEAGLLGRVYLPFGLSLMVLATKR